MAILELKINGIEAYLDNTSGAETGCLSLKSNQSDGEVDFGKGVKTTGGVFLKGRDVKDDKDVVTNYKVHMTNVDFKKRMYAPTEIIAVLNIFPVTPTSTTDNQNNNGPAPKPTWYPLTKDYIVSLFQNKKVTLQSEDGKVVGDDFYVEDILPRYKKDSMFVMLRIYSPDHQMALTQGSAVFVGKRFGTDVLANEVKKYIKPWCVDTIEVLKRKIAVKEAAIAKLDSETKDKSDEAYIKQKDKLEKEKLELEKDLNEKELKMESISYSGKMKVLAYDAVESETGRQVAEYVTLDELFARSDVIFLHCPLFPSTEGIINKDNIAKMKDGVILINNSRGQLVVEQDLADALNSGKVFAAGLDVVSTEPIRPDNPLKTAKNTIITPHISWAAQAARQRIMDITVDNVKSYIEGHPQNVVN